jgi:hypothetical protein
VVGPDTGLTTAVRLTKSNGPKNSDATVGSQLVVADPTIAEAQRVEVLGDSAYATGDMLHALDGRGWTPLVKPWPVKAAFAGGFTIDDLVPDHVAGTLTCPAGITRHLSPTRVVTFGAACRDCPLMAQCTTARDGPA